VVFRVIDLGPDRQISTREELSELGPPPEGTMRWVDIGKEGSSELEQVGKRFDFHPLAIEDCRHLDQRPKMEEYRDHLFLVTQSFSDTNKVACELQLHELHAFLGRQYLVTVHSDSILALEEVWQRVAANPALLERGADFLYYLLADRLVDANFPILDRITDELEALQDRVLEQAKREDLARIFELKRYLVSMRKVLSPQRDTMAMLARRGDPRVSEQTALYFRDVHDHLSRLTESIEANRDILANALDAYLSSVSNRTNEIMKYLTLLSAVFLPLAFIVGFFGQNFENLPGATDWPKRDTLMYFMIALCVVTPAVMLTWFRLRRWI
jgi:magnesium transporter